jgi:hypothetical protein
MRTSAPFRGRPTPTACAPTMRRERRLIPTGSLQRPNELRVGWSLTNSEQNQSAVQLEAVPIRRDCLHMRNHLYFPSLSSSEGKTPNLAVAAGSFGGTSGMTVWPIKSSQGERDRLGRRVRRRMCLACSTNVPLSPRSMRGGGSGRGGVLSDSLLEITFFERVHYWRCTRVPCGCG